MQISFGKKDKAIIKLSIFLFSDNEIDYKGLFSFITFNNMKEKKQIFI